MREIWSKYKMWIIAAAVVIILAAAVFIIRFRKTDSSSDDVAYVETVSNLTGRNAALGMVNRFSGVIEPKKSCSRHRSTSRDSIMSTRARRRRSRSLRKKKRARLRRNKPIIRFRSRSRISRSRTRNWIFRSKKERSKSWKAISGMRKSRAGSAALSRRSMMEAVPITAMMTIASSL